MPRGIKGSRKPAKKKAGTRKRTSAKLKVDESFFNEPITSDDNEFIYREALATAISLHAGKSIPLDELLHHAGKIANFLKGFRPAEIASLVPRKPVADEVLPDPAPPSLDIPQENHKSKFEITM